MPNRPSNSAGSRTTASDMPNSRNEAASSKNREWVCRETVFPSAAGQASVAAFGHFLGDGGAQPFVRVEQGDVWRQQERIDEDDRGQRDGQQRQPAAAGRSDSVASPARRSWAGILPDGVGGENGETGPVAILLRRVGNW